jgi:hypothetical protein
MKLLKQAMAVLGTEPDFDSVCLAVFREEQADRRCPYGVFVPRRVRELRLTTRFGCRAEGDVTSISSCQEMMTKTL